MAQSRLVMAAVALSLIAILVTIGLGVTVLSKALNPSTKASSFAQSQSDPNYTVLTITATGSVSAKPTLAQIVFGVQTQSENLTQALTQNDQISSRLISDVAQLGVNSDNIATLSFSIYPVYDSSGVLEYYQVSNTLEVNMSAGNITLVGQVVEAGVQAGATQVDSVSFTLSPAQMNTLEAQALNAALSNADQQAQRVASQLGLTIVGIKDISTVNRYYPPPIFYGPQTVGMVTATQPPQFYPGQTQYTVSVQVNYLLS